jgi:plastocyanin
MKRFLFTCLIALLVAASYNSCKKCDCPAPGTSATTQDIMLQNTAFSPAEKTISRGTKVTWINHDPYAHTVTSTTNIFDSGNMNQGQAFEYTFNTAGTYDYYCVYHASIMKGKIIVN